MAAAAPAVLPPTLPTRLRDAFGASAAGARLLPELQRLVLAYAYGRVRLLACGSGARAERMFRVSPVLWPVSQADVSEALNGAAARRQLELKNAAAALKADATGGAAAADDVKAAAAAAAPSGAAGDALVIGVTHRKTLPLAASPAPSKPPAASAGAVDVPLWPGGAAAVRTLSYALHSGVDCVFALSDGCVVAALEAYNGAAWITGGAEIVRFARAADACCTHVGPGGRVASVQAVRVTEAIAAAVARVDGIDRPNEAARASASASVERAAQCGWFVAVARRDMTESDYAVKAWPLPGADCFLLSRAAGALELCDGHSLQCIRCVAVEVQSKWKAWHTACAVTPAVVALSFAPTHVELFRVPQLAPVCTVDTTWQSLAAWRRLQRTESALSRPVTPKAAASEWEVEVPTAVAEDALANAELTQLRCVAAFSTRHDSYHAIPPPPPCAAAAAGAKADGVGIQTVRPAASPSPVSALVLVLRCGHASCPVVVHDVSSVRRGPRIVAALPNAWGRDGWMLVLPRGAGTAYAPPLSRSQTDGAECDGADGAGGELLMVFGRVPGAPDVNVCVYELRNRHRSHPNAALPFLHRVATKQCGALRALPPSSDALAVALDHETVVVNGVVDGLRAWHVSRAHGIRDLVALDFGIDARHVAAVPDW